MNKTDEKRTTNKKTMATMHKNFYTVTELLSMGINLIGLRRNVLVSRKCSIYNPQNLFIHDHVRIDDFSILSGKGEIILQGQNHVGSCSLLSSSTGIRLEKFSEVSPGSKLFGSNDDYSGHFLTNPTILNPKQFTNVKQGDIVLSRHAMIGSSSVVLPETFLREGSCLGALSFLKGETRPWGIYAGVPAKFLRNRQQNILTLEQKYVEEENRFVETEFEK